jgi:hypothetical protein
MKWAVAKLTNHGSLYGPCENSGARVRTRIKSRPSPSPHSNRIMQYGWCAGCQRWVAVR